MELSVNKTCDDQLFAYAFFLSLNLKGVLYQSQYPVEMHMWFRMS